jgi:hypothetical protein
MQLMLGRRQEREGAISLILSFVLHVARHFKWATFQGAIGLLERGTMRATIWNRIVLVAAIVAVSLVGMSISISALEQPPQNQTKQDGKKQNDQNRRQKHDNNRQQAEPQRQQDQNNQRQQQIWQQRQQNQDNQQQRQAEQQRRQDQNRQAQQPGQQQRLPERLAPQRQRQLIEQQQQRLTQYRQQVDRDQRLAAQRIEQLRNQKRTEQYRFQQQYQERIRQQRVRFPSHRDHDYYNDPFYYTAPNYRYIRGGIYYETNQYGVNLLRQAVNYGYAEGFQAGRADRADRWRYDYSGSYAYQDASYGYIGLYIGRDDYNYYFREGFRRGYEDGFYRRQRYGRYENNSYSVLDGILTGILILSSIH